MIRCVIADDEPLAIRLLEDHLRRLPELTLHMATTEPLEALKALQEDPVDLLFLDIRMPGLSGLDIMPAIPAGCQVIVVSAYSEYAIDGFEHNITDYLLKPVSFSRFLKAITKAKQKINNTVSNAPDFAYLKVEQRMHRVDFHEIFFVEGLKDYVLIHLVSGRITALQTMKNMEELLLSENFVRVHKSFIVAIRNIEQIHKQHIVVNNTIIPIGEFYKSAFLRKVLNG